MNDSGTLLFLLLPLLLFGWLFWSQRRRMRDLQALQASVAVGDEVRTTSGLYGRIVLLTDTDMTLEISPGVRVRFDRRAVDVKVPPAGAVPPGPGPEAPPSDRTDG